MMRHAFAVSGLIILAVSRIAGQRPAPTPGADEGYLTWRAAEASATGQSTDVRGRVGGRFDGRLLKTDRAYNYKLAATLFTPEVIRASARFHQLAGRLSTDETRKLVADAEAIGGTIVMIEIDPREGSGVIPVDWQAFLQPRGNAAAGVRGVNMPQLRNLSVLAGVMRRNYDYDRFWMVFPIDTETTPSAANRRALELVVHIHDKEGRVEWTPGR
jgi:hypothetical protein